MSSCLVDINVWVALSHAGHTHHRAARSWFDNLTDTAYFCRQTQTGLLRLLTNPRVMAASVLTQTEAWRVYDAILEDPRVGFIHEPQGIETLLRQLTNTRSSATRAWGDAYLGSFARALGLRVVSFDRVFSAMPGVSATVL